MNRHIQLICATTIAFMATPNTITAQILTLQDKLFNRALQSTTCEQIPNNGRYCTYRFGDVLEVGIKDVGGTDPVIGFHHSDWQNELYAVMYFGCISVVPGASHPKNYDSDYGVFISPKTGLVYRTLNECTKTL